MRNFARCIDRCTDTWHTMGMTTTAATALLTATDTDTLITSALVLDAMTSRTETERLALAWTLDEIEARNPQATAAMVAWTEDLDSPLSYTEALVLAVAA